MTNLRSIGRLDLLVSESYEGVESAPSGGLQAHLLLTEPLLLVLPRGETTPEPVALGTLRDTAWIAGLVGTQFAAVLEHACRSAGFGARVVHRADDAVLIQSLVRSGLGVALLPALACRDSYRGSASPAPHRPSRAAGSMRSSGEAPPAVPRWPPRWRCCSCAPRWWPTVNRPGAVPPRPGRDPRASGRARSRAPRTSRPRASR
ncbi:MAG: LysR substrate-binding domain-containing protein [Thermoleophilaceae bacterium]